MHDLVGFARPSSSAPAGTPAYYRARRHKREMEQARTDLRLILAADARLRVKGQDQICVAFAHRLGFERHDLIILRVALGRRPFTLITAPLRIWHRHKLHAQLIGLKRLAANAGIRTLLVPMSQLKRQPRFGNAELIAATAASAISIAQRLRIEVHLHCVGCCTIGECVALLPDHPMPLAAVLSLVWAGRIVVPLGIPLSAITPVVLPASVSGS